MTKAELIAQLAAFPDDAVVHVWDRRYDGGFMDASEVRSEVRNDWNNWDGNGEIPKITVIEIDN